MFVPAEGSPDDPDVRRERAYGWCLDFGKLLLLDFGVLSADPLEYVYDVCWKSTIRLWSVLLFQALTLIAGEEMDSILIAGNLISPIAAAPAAKAELWERGRCVGSRCETSRSLSASGMMPWLMRKSMPDN